MKLKPPYKHLVQKPYLCGPTCLQMVILRRGLGWIDQEQIAKETNTTILVEAKKSFSTPLKIAQNPDDVGINLGEFKEPRFKTFFRKHNLPIKISVFYISDIKDIKKFIKQKLEEGDDVMANIHMKYFDKKKKFGHFTLITKFEGDKVTLCDPQLTNKSFWETELDELEKSMGKQFDKKERGFVVFSKI